MDEKDIKKMQKVASRVTKEHHLKFMAENEGRIKKEMEELRKKEIENEVDENTILW